MMSTAKSVFLILMLHIASGDVNNYGAVYKPHPIHIHELQQSMLKLEKIDGQLDMEVIEKLSSLSSKHLLSALQTLQGVSKGCQEGFDDLTSSLSQQWVLQVFDSWGKLGPGILEGRTRFPGNFDECKNASGNLPAKSVPFESNYCMVYLPIIPNVITLSMGTCVPKQCNATEVTMLYNEVLSKVPELPLRAYSASCQEEDYTLSSGRIAALFFVLLMVGLCVVATLFEGVHQLVNRYYASQMEESESREETTPLIPTTQPVAGKYNSSDSYSVRAILSFSLYSNITKLMDTNQPPGAITCLNGIRFFSMTWVILGHSFLLISFTYIDNPLYIMTLYKRFASEVIMNATVSVDTFFVLSGLLVSYLFLKDFHKRKARLVDFAKGLPLMYLHRYLRLTPAYGFLILIYTSLLWFVSDGPFWPNYPTPPYQTFDQNCVNNWYLNILYVNNIFKVSKQCAAWGWYLGNDMQFFLVAPFIVYLMYRYKKIGVAFCIATILGSIVAALVVSGEQHVTFAISPLAHNNVTTVEDIKLPYYNVPWTRYQTYGIGLLAGFLIFELRKRSYKIPTLLNLALWGVSAALCMSVVYGPFSANMGYHVVYLPEDIFYSGLARSAWALGISFVMISCSLNQGGWVNEFLSWKGFVPLSRMTYCAYLVHIPGLLVIFNTARHGILFTDIQLTLTLILCLTVAFLLAFVFSLIFEMPFINLDKLFLAPLSLKKGRDEVVVKPVEEPPPRYVEREAAGYTPLPS